ncbi:MAG: ABC transporter ATP-binding protein [Pseudonocardiaceae bacterium]|nr:ABC transporter ATP-binding protein [Pseudonocardiaceae bacterium]
MARTNRSRAVLSPAPAERAKSVSLTTIAALHDLDHATAYCDDLVLLHAGRVLTAGDPTTVLTPERVAKVFGVRSAIVPHPITGRPHFVTAS